MLPSKPGRKCKHNYLWSSIRNKHLHSSGDAYCGQAVLGGGTKRWNWKLPNQVNGGTELFSCAVWGGEEALFPPSSFLFFPCLSFFLLLPQQAHCPSSPKVIILLIPEQNPGPSGSWQKSPQFPLATSVFYSNLSTRCYQKKFLKPWLSQSPLTPSWAPSATPEARGLFEAEANPQPPTPTPVVFILLSTWAITCQ